MGNLKIRIGCLLITVLFLFSSSASCVLALINYSYDQNGNMVSDGERCYTYNDANQVSKVKKCSSGQAVAEYIYDYTGRRIVKKEYENGILKQTIYSPDKSYETKKLANNTIQNTSYYYANDELVARKNPDSSKVFYHNDHLGSTSILTDQNGKLVEETTYYPYGDIRLGGTKSKYLYTGQEKDTGTELYYYGARYYNSHIRRFTQPDTQLPDPYDPQQLNRYAYVRNNPMIYTDPSGHCIWDACLIELGIAAPVLAPAVILVATHPEVIEIGAGTLFSGYQGIKDLKSGDYKSAAANFGMSLIGGFTIKQGLKSSYKTSSQEDVSIKTQNTKTTGSNQELISGKNPLEIKNQEYHGNDLRNTKTTFGYSIRDKTTDEILKFGETINPASRYSQKWLDENNYIFKPEEIGSKFDMHYWQHNQILDYIENYGTRPLLNKSNW